MCKRRERFHPEGKIQISLTLEGVRSSALDMFYMIPWTGTKKTSLKRRNRKRKGEKGRERERKGRGEEGKIMNLVRFFVSVHGTKGSSRVFYLFCFCELF